MKKTIIALSLYTIIFLISALRGITADTALANASATQSYPLAWEEKINVAEMPSGALTGRAYDTTLWSVNREVVSSIAPPLAVAGEPIGLSISRYSKFVILLSKKIGFANITKRIVKNRNFIALVFIIIKIANFYSNQRINRIKFMELIKEDWGFILLYVASLHQTQISNDILTLNIDRNQITIK